MAVEQLGGLTALGAVLSPLDGAGPRTDAVVARISAAIGLGVMTDGEQLPSEIDLATQLGVSTMTLREALAVLREQGLVETRRGRGGGSFVRASADAVNTRSLARLHELTVEELRDLGDEHFADRRRRRSAGGAPRGEGGCRSASRADGSPGGQ